MDTYLLISIACILGLIFIKQLSKLYKTLLRPYLNGIVGELRVAHLLKRLPKEEYTVFNDLVLVTNYGTTQIDHVVISTNGIFVIETKNYKGHIYGGEMSENWRQFIKGKKTIIQNPIRQNKIHVNAIKDIIKSEIPFLVVQSIIAFSNRSKISVSSTRDCFVVHYKELIPLITSFKTPIMMLEEKEKIVSVIDLENIVGRKARREHIKQVKAQMENREHSINVGFCPYCGSKLVLRCQGKDKPFIGCSNYPSCNYIHKIN